MTKSTAYILRLMACKPLTLIRGPCQFAERGLWHHQHSSTQPSWIPAEISSHPSPIHLLSLFWPITSCLVSFSSCSGEQPNMGKELVHFIKGSTTAWPAPFHSSTVALSLSSGRLQSLCHLWADQLGPGCGPLHHPSVSVNISTCAD